MMRCTSNTRKAEKSTEPPTAYSKWMKGICGKKSRMNPDSTKYQRLLMQQSDGDVKSRCVVAAKAVTPSTASAVTKTLSSTDVSSYCATIMLTSTASKTVKIASSPTFVGKVRVRLGFVIMAQSVPKLPIMQTIRSDWLDTSTARTASTPTSGAAIAAVSRSCKPMM